MDGKPDMKTGQHEKMESENMNVNLKNETWQMKRTMHIQMTMIMTNENEN
jgi:hypothetical protein